MIMWIMGVVGEVLKILKVVPPIYGMKNYYKPEIDTNEIWVSLTQKKWFQNFKLRSNIPLLSGPKVILKCQV